MFQVTSLKTRKKNEGEKKSEKEESFDLVLGDGGTLFYAFADVRINVAGDVLFDLRNFTLL